MDNPCVGIRVDLRFQRQALKLVKNDAALASPRYCDLAAAEKLAAANGAAALTILAEKSVSSSKTPA